VEIFRGRPPPRDRVALSRGAIVNGTFPDTAEGSTMCLRYRRKGISRRFAQCPGTFLTIVERSRKQRLMYNGAREMYNMHAGAGWCRRSGCKESGRFLGILRGWKAGRGKHARRSAIGGPVASCGEPQVGAACAIFFRDYTSIDIHFRGGPENRGIDFAERERGCASGRDLIAVFFLRNRSLRALGLQLGKSLLPALVLDFRVQKPCHLK
jgi:hypothetical protein